MKKLYTLIFGAALPLLSTGQAIVHTSDIPNRYRDVYAQKAHGKRVIETWDNLLSTQKATEEMRQQPALSRAGQTEARLIVKLAIDESKEERRPYSANIIPASSESIWDTTWGEFDEDTRGYIFDLPCGTYNFYTTVESPRGMIYMVKEDIVVNGDLTISMDTREATTHISFKTLNQAGEEIKDNLLDPATGYTTVLDPGNIADMTWYINLLVFYRGSFIESYKMNSCRTLNEDGTITSPATDEFSVWVTDNGIFSFGRVDSFGDDTGLSYVAHYAPPHTSTGELVNDPADYVTVHENIIPTPHIQTLDPEDTSNFPIVSSANKTFYVVPKKGGLPQGKDGSVLISQTDLGIPNNIMNICSPGNGGFEIWPAVSISQDISREGYGVLEGAKVRVNPDRSITRIGTVASANPFSSLCDAEGEVAGEIDPNFCVDSSPLFAYGESTPITIVDLQPFSTENYQFEFSFAGRFNEPRPIDRLTAEVSMKVNGETVIDNIGEIREIFNSWWKNPLEKGKIELDITNTNHKTPEGLEGLNTLHMEYDTRLGDYEAPVLLGLKIADPAWMPQQSFQTKEDAAWGFIDIAAADRTMSDIGPYYHLDNPAPGIEVEYAPYGTENFSVINVEERPDWFNAPEFGHHFIGSLPAVTEKASHGWYDLRITLTDAAGNFQQQLIRPAFQIREMASVTDTEYSYDEPEVTAIYNLHGIRVEQPSEPGIYIESMSDGTYRKAVR